MQLGDEHPFRFLVYDRDTKFSRAFDDVFRTEGIKVIRTPVHAPNANAYVERWVRTVRSECLDRILILGRHHLEHVLRVYRRHYNDHRAHRPLDLLPPNGANQRRRQRLIRTSAVATYWADSSMNTRPPEFANPTPFSFVNAEPAWTPTLGTTAGEFTMADVGRFVEGQQPAPPPPPSPGWPPTQQQTG